MRYFFGCANLPDGKVAEAGDGLAMDPYYGAGILRGLRSGVDIINTADESGKMAKI